LDVVDVPGSPHGRTVRAAQPARSREDGSFEWVSADKSGPEILARLRLMTTVPLSEAKDRLSALVDAAETTHEIVTITRHGREAAVLMAKSDLDSLHETIFWLSQPGVRDDIEQARHELAEGRTVSASDLRTEYGLPE